jgi:hypothetical protein
MTTSGTKLMRKRVIKSGNYVEVYNYERPVAYNFQVRREDSIRKAVEKRKDNINRARKRIVRLALANAQKMRSIFITLTYAENMQDREQCMHDVRAFFRLMKREYPRSAYLYTLERQKRGAWHVHMLVFNVAFIDMSWLDKAWRFGFTNVKSTTDDKHRAHYIAKYLGKDMSEGNKRVFSCSLNLLQPEEFKYFLNTPHFVRGKKLVYSTGYFNPMGNFVTLKIFYAP